MKKLFIIALATIMMMSTGNIVSAQSKILVAYFSRTGHEYGVGNISKGNTHIIAEMIAEATGADLFEIKTVKKYPSDYKKCTSEASREKALKARPNLANKVDNMSEYDVVFIGYPIWYGDMPMAVYTFIENYDFSGKKIIPFCTHGGSGLSSTDQAITLECPNSPILPGFEIKGAIAQKQQKEARAQVLSWLEKIKPQF